jgi:hypothetical protein
VGIEDVVQGVVDLVKGSDNPGVLVMPALERNATEKVFDFEQFHFHNHGVSPDHPCTECFVDQGPNRDATGDARQDRAADHGEGFFIREARSIGPKERKAMINRATPLPITQQ